MGLRRRIAQAAVAITLLSMASTGLHAASPGTATVLLSGRVTNQSGTGLPGSTVDVLLPGTTTIVASDSADASGDYAVSIEAGTYDVRVTPPAGSGFGVANAPARAIVSDATLDFVLVPAGAVTLSGRVIDGAGHPLGNQYVTLTPAGGTSLPSVYTGAGGEYSFTVSAGDYHLALYGYNVDPVAAPHYYSVNTNAPLSLTSSAIVDLQPPFRPVNVRVQDPGGNPVENVALTTQGMYSPMTFAGVSAYGYSYYFSWDPTRTDASGNATMWLFQTNDPPHWGLYTISAAPPAGSTLATTNQAEVVVPPATSPLVITLAPPVRLSGRVLDPYGTPLPNHNVTLTPAGGTSLPTVTTPADGSYSFAVAPGTYHLALYGYSSDPTAAPHYYSINTNTPLALTADTVLDLQPPFQRVDVHVQTPGGSAVENTALTTQGMYSPMTFAGVPAYGYSYYFSWDPTRTDASGNATMWLFSTHDPPHWGLYTITAAPPAGSPLATTNRADVAVPLATSPVLIVLAEPVVLSGRVLDPLGTPLANHNVTLTPAGGTSLPTVTTPADGSYSFAVAPGNYHLALYGYSSDPIAAPHYYSLNTNTPLTLSENTVIDLRLPARRVAVHVQDLAGNPVADVTLTTQGMYSPMTFAGVPGYGYSYYFSWDPTRTDAAGNATMWLFPTHDPPHWGLYTITAGPPADSPFATFNVQNVTVVDDKEMFIVLQFVHDPPVTGIALTPAPDGGGVYPDPVTISLTATASPGYTVAATYYSLDGGSTATYAGPFAVAGGGSHTIRYWSIDNSGVFNVPQELTFEISRGTATTTTVPSSAGQYSDVVTLTATVAPATFGSHTIAGTVAFTVNGTAVGSAPVDSLGTATLTQTIGLPAGSYDVGARFASTSSSFVNSNGSSTLAVSREDATVTAAASNPAVVQVGAGGGSAAVTLCAAVAEPGDGSAGNTAHAVPVTFTLAPVGPGSPLVQTATISGGSVGGTVTGCASIAAVPANVYDISIEVGGGYYSGAGETVLAVVDPSLGFITGGGTIARGGFPANLGFNAKLKAGGAQGSLLYRERRLNGEIEIKSTLLSSLSISGNTAIFVGAARLNGVDGYSFRATAIDNGEPGVNDAFGLQVRAPDGALVVDLAFSPVVLSGGNIQVHR